MGCSRTSPRPWEQHGCPPLSRRGHLKNTRASSQAQNARNLTENNILFLPLLGVRSLGQESHILHGEGGCSGTGRERPQGSTTCGVMGRLRPRPCRDTQGPPGP